MLEKVSAFVANHAITLVSVTGGVLLIFALSAKKIKGKRAKVVNGALPLIGHAHKMSAEVISEFVRESWVATGKTDFELFALDKRILCVSDWKLATYLLSSRPKLLRRPRSFDGWAREVGMLSGLFNASEEETWGRMRRLTNPAFAKSSIDQMFSLICEVTKTHFDSMEAESKSTTDGVCFNGLTMFVEYTVKMICLLAFGSHAQEIDYIKNMNIAADVGVLFAWIFRRSMLPLPGFIWKLLRFCGDELENSALSVNDRVRKCVHAIIDNYKTAKQQQTSTVNNTNHSSSSSSSSSNSSEPASLLTKLMEASDPEAQSSSRKTLSDDEVYAQIATFLLAGVETTSSLLSSCLAELCRSKHVNLVRELQAEIQSAIASTAAAGGSCSNMVLTAAQINALPLLQATITETHRLHSPGPMIFLQYMDAPKALQLPDGYVISGQDEVIVNGKCIMLDEDVYENPNVFNPYRWLPANTSADRLKLMKERMLSFGYGPRMCPGMRLADVESICAMAYVLHNFDFSLQDGYTVEKDITFDVFYFTCRPDKLPIKLTRRVNKA